MVLTSTRLAVRVQSNIGIIRAGVSRGLSSSGIQSLIRSTGQAGLRRTDLLAGMRHVQGIESSASRIRSVTLDRFPDPSRIEIAKGPMFRNFSYDIRIRGFHRELNRMVDRFITVRSDINMTPRMLQDEAQRVLDEAPEQVTERYPIDIESITVVGARRRG